MNLVLDPLPGGCNVSESIDPIPYHEVSYTDYLIKVKILPSLNLNNNCNDSSVNIDIYHMYLEENDFSYSSYFEGIRNMLSVNNIVKYGRKVRLCANVSEE